MASFTDNKEREFIRSISLSLTVFVCPVLGEEKMKVTGLVKYVGRLGTGGNTPSMFVGLKLDLPGKICK